jgi:pimeloyl-ACP methyl ester carboxylesterase
VPTARPLEARSGPVTLAGTLWEPDTDAVATVLMHPGSGPSNRDNDVYFPQIRALLLDAGIAAASFDKRGVGGSTGDWRDAGIAEQAADATAAFEAMRAAGAPEPIGLFGHSQGGWVVIDAAVRGAPAAFVITNGGPGVSPAVQDRFALANAGRRAGRSPEGVERLLARYDLMVELLRDGVRAAEVAARLGPPDDDELEAYGGTGDAAEWELHRRLVDHDPRPALRRLAVPVLALFGAEDEITPVAVSVEAFRAEVRPDLLTVAVLPGGDHRAQAGEPRRLVDGYRTALVGFVRAAAGVTTDATGAGSTETAGGGA